MLYFFVFLSTSCILVHSRLLHPHDQAVGLWNLTLFRRDRILLESMVFPPLSACEKAKGIDVAKSEEEEESDILMGKDHEERREKLRSTLKKARQKRLECELLLKTDGTFILSPPCSLNGFGSVKRVPLEGRWKIRRNPYCVTDRHYDELTLVSYPKVRFNPFVQEQNIKNDAEDKSMEELDRESLTLEMHCKVWGRYGCNAIRQILHFPQGRDASRMTHGTLSFAKIRKTMKDVGDRDSMKLSAENIKMSTVRRIVCATFHARSSSDNENMEEEENELWEDL